MSSHHSSSPSAGRGRGRGYGIDNSPLRKPNESRTPSRPGSNCSTPSRGNQSPLAVKITHSDSSVSSSSSLDISANEFVPRAVKSQPSLSVTAAPFVPPGGMSFTVQSEMSAGPQTADQMLIRYLENTLFKLLMNPSSYEYSMDDFATNLSTKLVDKESMEIASDVIFEWAVTKPNFSYTCSRVCQYLAQNIPNNHNGPILSFILKRCHKEHRQMSDLVRTDQTRACSFAVFLAELYTKPIARIPKVMSAILEIVELMIAQLNDSIAKTVGQVMKMCGACLEDDLAMLDQPATEKMDKIISDICSKANKEGLSRSMSGLLMSVVTLRQANWGRSVSPAQTPPATPSPGEFTNEPVFFSLTGQRITREQAGFADDDDDTALSHSVFETAAGGWSVGDDITSTGPGGDFSEADDYNDLPDDLDILVIDDPEEDMTDDMWEAYEKFESEQHRHM